MSKNSPIKISTTYSPSHRGVDEWHRERNAPGNAPSTSTAAPGNAPLLDVGASGEVEGRQMTPAESLIAALADALKQSANAAASTATVTATVTVVPSFTVERMWSCPDPTRLWLHDVAAALGKSPGALRKWVERHNVPHRKVGVDVVFEAGELRRWWRDHEKAVNPYVGRPR